MGEANRLHRWGGDTIRSLAYAVIALAAGWPLHPALAQQPSRPPSIADWLEAERTNPNLQPALQAYRRATASPRPDTSTKERPIPARAAAPADRDAPTFNEDRIVGYASEAPSPASGVYIAGHVGNAFVMDSDYEADAATLTALMEPLGLYASGAVGMDIGGGLSLEAALAYQSADVDEVSLTRLGSFTGLNVTESDVEGSMSALSLMANGRLEFAQESRVRPYLTGGLGLARVAIDDLKDDGGTILPDDSDFVFAYQAGTGVMLPLSNSTSVDLGYRYFATTDADLSDQGAPYTAGFESHVILIGMKHRL